MKLKFCVKILVLLVLGVSSIQAQTNFVWTNNTGGTWSTTNKWNTATPPSQSGSNDYIITFNTNVTLTATNNLGSPNFTLNQLIFNAGTITLYSGSGTNLVFTNSTTETAPMLWISGGGAFTINQGITLASATLFTNSAAKLLTINGVIGGSGPLTIGASSTSYNNDFIFNATNTYSGGTTINAGRVRSTATNPYILGTGSVTINSGGQYLLDKAVTVTNAFTIAGIGASDNNGAIRTEGNGILSGAITLAADSRIGIGNANQTGTVSGVIGGNYALQVFGFAAGGFVSLTGSNTFNGGLMLSNITLRINADAALGTVPDPAATNLTFAGASTLLAGTNVTLAANRTILINSGITATLNTTNNTLTINGEITGAGNITKTGTGTLVLNGTNTFTGNLTLNNAGIVIVSTSAALGTNATAKTINIFGNTPGQTLILNGSAGDLNFDKNINFVTSYNGGNGAISNAAGNNTINGQIQLTGGGGYTKVAVNTGSSLNLAGTVSNVTTGVRDLLIYGGGSTIISGSIVDGSGANVTGLEKYDAGTLTLTGTNTYTSQTLISGGTLRLSPTGSISNSQTITVNATFDVSSVADYTLFAGQTLLGGGTVTGNVIAAGRISPGAVGIAGTLTFASDLTLANGGTNLIFDLTSTNAIGAGINDLLVVAGNLTNTGNLIAINMLAGPTNATYTLINYTGAKTDTFSNLVGNTTRKIMTLDETTPGQVNLLVSGSFSNITWQPTVNGDWDFTTSNWLSSAGADLFFEFDTVNFTDAGAGTNTVNLTAAVRPTAVLVNSSSDYTFNGTGKISGATSILKDGAGALIIATSNDFTGGVAVSNGVLRAANNGALGAGSAVIAGAGELQYSNGVTLANALTLAGALRNVSSNNTQSGAVTLTAAASINSDAGQLTVSGPVTNAGFGLAFGGVSTTLVTSVISGTGGLVKNGTGVLILSNLNTYTGGTIISNGMLTAARAGGAANGTLPPGQPVTVMSNAVLRFGTGDAIGYGAANPSVITNSGTVTIVAGGHVTAGVFVFNGGALSSEGAGDGYGNYIFDGNITTIASSSTALINAAKISLRGGATVNGPVTFNVDRGTGPVDLLVTSVLTNLYAVSGLVKSGNGIMTLTATNTYNSATTINGGTLALGATGSISNSATITVGSGAVYDVSAKTGYTLYGNQTLNGAGVVTGAVTAALGAKILPGSTLGFANDLTLTAGATNLFFDLTSAASDLVNVGGTFTATNSVFAFTFLDQTTNGNYLIATYGALDTTFNPTLLQATRKTLSLDTNTANQIYLTVGGSYASLLWQPTTASSNLWNINANASWTNLAAGTADKFYDLDTVTFDDTGAAYSNGIVNLTVAVRPAAVFVNSASNYTFTGAGKITGITGLIKDGNGMLTISNANDYTGATIVSNGILRAGNASAFGSNVAPLTVVAGALDLNAQNLSKYNVTLAGGMITNSSGTTQTNAFSNLTVTGNSTIGGFGRWDVRGTTAFTVINPGVTLTKTDTNLIYIMVDGAVTNDGQVVVNQGALGLWNARTAGAGSFTVNGSGYLRVENSTNSLPVFLNGGTLGNAIASASSLQSGNVTLLTNSILDVVSQNLIISGNITETNGSFGFTKTGANVLILTGTNTYTGGTTVSAGTLRLGNSTPSGNLGSGDVTNAATVQFLRTDAYTVSNNFILAAGATLNQSGTGPVILAGNIGSVGGTNGTIVQAANAGTLTLAGTNSFATLTLDGLTTNMPTVLATGSSNTITTINVGNGTAYGRLHIETGAAVRVTGSLYLGQATSRTGEVVNAGNISVGAQVRVGHYPTETSTFTMNGGSLIITGSSASNPFAGGGEQNGALYLGIDGTGIFIQNGGLVQAQGLVLDNRGDTAGIDTYTLAGGSLILSNWGIQGNASTLFNAGGGTISATANWTGSRPMNLTNLNGFVTFDPAGYAITISGVLSGTGGLTNNGAGTLILSASNTYTGGTFPIAGTLQLGNNSAAGSIIDTNLTIPTGAALAFARSDNITSWITIDGGGTLVQKGGGILTITNVNPYTGDTVINGGTLNVSALDNIGVAGYLGAGTNLVFGGGALRYTGGTTGIDRPVLLNAGGTFDVSNATTVLTLDGLLSGTGSLTKSGAGTLVLTASNLHTGVTAINAGILQLSGGDNRLPVGSPVSFTGNSTLDLDGNSQTIPNLTLTGSPRTGIVTNGQLIITGTNDLVVGTTAANSYQQLNLSGLNSFTYNAPTAALRVGYNAAGANATGELYLARTGTNLITASYLNVGRDYTSAQAVNSVGFLHLGATNILNVDTFLVAWARCYGTVDVASGLSNVYVRIRGKEGTDTDYAVITNGYTSAGAGGLTRGDIILTNATLDARVSSLVLAFHTSANASGTTNSFLMGPGTLIATNILIAHDEGSGNGVLGTFGLYGGTVQALNITIGDRTGSGAVNGIFNFNSGTIQAQAIQGGAGTATRNFNWTTGTITNYDSATDLTITNLTVNLLTAADHVFALDTGRTGTVSAVVAGAGNLIKNGDGVLILTGSNTYSGPTAVNAGQLVLNNRWAAQNSTVSNLVPGGVIFTTITNAFVLGGLAGTGDIALTNGSGPVALAIGNNSQSASYSGILSSGNTLTKLGTGLQVLTGTNTYAGDTFINGGILRVEWGVGLPTTGNLVISGGVWETASGLATNWGTGPGQFQVPGGASGFSAYNNPLTVDLGGTGATVVWGTNLFNPTTLILNETTANTNLTFNNRIDFGGSTRTIAVNANVATITGVLTNGGLTKTGAGTLVLTAANVYTNGTTLSAGALRMANTAALGAAGQTLNLNGGTLQLGTDTAVSSKNVIMGGSAAVVLDRANYGTGFNTTFGNFRATAGSYTLTVTNGPNVADTASLTFSGIWSNSGQTTTFNIGTGSVLTLSGTMPAGAQTVSVVKNGGGRLVLSGGYGTWDGGNAIALNAGTLDLRVAPGDSGNFRSVTAADGTMLALTADSSVNFYSGLTANGNTTVLLDRITPSNGVTHTLGTLAIGAYTLTVAAGANMTNGTAGLTFSGTATLSSNATIVVNDGATVDTLLRLNGVTGAGRNLTIDGTGDTTIAGAITTGAGSLTKLGLGTLTLSGTNTYTGGTFISNGTLALGASALMTNTVRFELQPGAILDVTAAGLTLGAQELKGSGTVLGSVTAGTGATITPGNSVGTLTVGNLTLTNGVSLNFELGATNASDKVIVNNTLSLDGMNTNWFVLSAVGGFGAGEYTLFDATSIIGSLGSETNFADIGGYTGYLWLDTGANDVKLTVVPEPGTGTLVGAGLLAMFLLGRWRRR